MHSYYNLFGIIPGLTPCEQITQYVWMLLHVASWYPGLGMNHWYGWLSSPSPFTIATSNCVQNPKFPTLYNRGWEHGHYIAWNSESLIWVPQAQVSLCLAEYVGDVFTVPPEQSWQRHACGLLVSCRFRGSGQSFHVFLSTMAVLGHCYMR